MKLNLDGIEALDAIVRNGSFASAADELNKAQSAVSYAIKQLEDRLGVEVFDRSGHRATLTGAGRVVLEEGQNLLASARRIEGLADRVGEGWEPRLEVVIDGILPQEPIMRVLKEMADQGIPTQIQVKVEFLGGVQYRFEREDADLMLVKDYSAREFYETQPLPEVVSVLVAAPDHPLASAEALSLRELQRHVELSIHDSSGAEISEDPTMFGGSRIFYLSDFNTKAQALRMGLGFGWVPIYLIRGDLERGTLVELPYERGSRYGFTPLLVHRIDRPPGRTARRFMEMLQE